jgi:hypothetical protein
MYVLLIIDCLPLLLFCFRHVRVQRLKGGNPTTGLPSFRLITHLRELNITFKPQCEDNRTANLTNCGKKMVKWKWKKQNIIKYATWNVRYLTNSSKAQENYYKLQCLNGRSGGTKRSSEVVTVDQTCCHWKWKIKCKCPCLHHEGTYRE